MKVMNAWLSFLHFLSFQIYFDILNWFTQSKTAIGEVDKSLCTLYDNANISKDGD